MLLKNQRMEGVSMNRLLELKNKVLSGDLLEKSEALELVEMPLEDLCEAANALRLHFCGNAFDICTIINGKSGNLSVFCAF